MLLLVLSVLSVVLAKSAVSILGSLAKTDRDRPPERLYCVMNSEQTHNDLGLLQCQYHEDRAFTNGRNSHTSQENCSHKIHLD